jgi:hypothetical protein
MTPIGKRHFAERYARLAKSAYAAGDLDVALRYANLAIHFDPLHQGAINLHSEILEAAPGLELAVDDHLHPGLPILQHPHTDYSKRGYPWSDPDDAHGFGDEAHLYITDEPPSAVIHDPTR